MGAGNVSRKGVTPVVAIVLLLMMTVGAAGAAYTWFSQMQQQLQEKARTQLQSQLEVKDLECNAEPENTVEVALKNSGDTTVRLGRVDMFIRDSSGHLNITVTRMDLSQPNACNGNECRFDNPGGFSQFTVNVSDPTYDNQPGSGTVSPSDAKLVPGSFYTVKIGFTNSDISVSAGGCHAE
ncbi:MAG: archaellin/type IV pilin N-terminal domain-containing protein [Candidatus Nanohaloarchaea archaeon]|nr:archaellin/type IV pilin N-terminal domain-containing protein [Candidatus Nanohaloarchaea archaeon]